MLDLSWKPDRTLLTPLYKQIIDFFRTNIADGTLAMGTRLPSQRDLAMMFNVNRSTIVEAMDQLTAEGLIEGSESGTRVSTDINTVNSVYSLSNLRTYPKGGTYHCDDMEVYNAQLGYEAVSMIDFSIEPDSKKVLDNILQNVFRKVARRVSLIEYEPAKGTKELREALISYLSKRGIDTNTDCILITSGVLQGYHLISLGLLKRGSLVLTESTSWLQSVQIFQSTGMILDSVRIDNQGIRIDDLCAKHRKTPAALLCVHPTFQNPTSITMDTTRRSNLVNICNKLSLPLVEDEVARDLWIDEPAPPPIKSFDKNSNVIYMGSMSRTLGPRVNLGWLVGSKDIIDHLANIKLQIDNGSSTWTQLVLAELINSGLYDEILEILRPHLKEKHDLIFRMLDYYLSDYCTWHVPDGGFWLWIKFKNSVNIKKIFVDAYNKGIIINPGYCYDKKDKQHIKLTYAGISQKDIEIGIKNLSNIIKNSVEKC